LCCENKLYEVVKEGSVKKEAFRYNYKHYERQDAEKKAYGTWMHCGAVCIRPLFLVSASTPLELYYKSKSKGNLLQDVPKVKSYSS
jgi:hypothetical protein